MSHKRKHYLPVTLLFALAVIFALPLVAAAQGRGNGNGRGPNLDRKCAKFVNCHDARDGRLDGRGPAVNQIGRQPDVDIFGNGRNRTRDRDEEVFYPRSRNRRVDRHGDGDIDRDDSSRRRDGSERRDRRVRRQDRITTN